MGHRLTLLTLILAFSVLWTRDATAAPLARVSFVFPFSYQLVEFGPGRGIAQIDDGFDSPNDDRLSGPNGSFQILDGGFGLTSGPLVDIVADTDDATYVHGSGGSLAISFDLHLPNDATHRGSFLASLDGFEVTALNTRDDGGEVRVDLGPGVFDPRTAKLLGITGPTLPASVVFPADTFDDYPDPDREVVIFGDLELRAEVPEPASLALAAYGVLAVAFRRRRARRACRG